MILLVELVQVLEPICVLDVNLMNSLLKLNLLITTEPVPLVTLLVPLVLDLLLPIVLLVPKLLEPSY